MTRVRRYFPVLYLAILPLFPLWRAVFLGEVIGPFDQIRHMSPWAAPMPDQPWDVLQADGSLQFYGWRSMVLEAWGKGQIPAWNPYELAGTPLLSNSQSAGFYPPLILLGVLHLPVGLAITLLAWLHLFWAGLGVFWLVRAFGGRPIPAAMAGGMFSCSTFMLGWTGLSSVIYTCSWFPWALAFLIASFRDVGSDKRRWVAPGLAVSVGMMFLAGHLQFAAFGIIAIAITWFVKLLDRQAKGSFVTAVAILIGLGLSAPQVLPSLQYSKFSHRRNVPTEEGYQGYTSLAIKPFELANLASPTALGNPRKWSSLENPRISSYWPALVKPGANLAESAITIGPLLLTLIFMFPWLQKRYWPLGKWAALSLLIAMGTPIDRLLYFFVPGWSATGSPGRAIFLFLVAAAVMGGLVLSQEGAPKWNRDKKVVGLALLATLLTLGISQVNSLPPEAKFMVTEGATGGLLDWLMGIAVAWLCLAFYRTREEVLYVAPLGAMLSLLFVLVPTGKPLEPVEGPPNGARIAAVNDRWDILTNQLALLPPNTAAINHIHELGGYDSLLHVDTVNLLKEVDGADPAPAANGNMMFVKSGASPALLSDAGVTEVWTLKSDPDDPSGKHKLPQIVKTPLPGPGRASVDGRAASITDEGFDRLTVTATGPGHLVLRDRLMPGWTAKIDGKTTAIGGTRWRELDIPAGNHEIQFRYSPPGMRNGLLISVGALLSLAGLALLPRSKASDALRS